MFVYLYWLVECKQEVNVELHIRNSLRLGEVPSFALRLQILQTIAELYFNV